MRVCVCVCKLVPAQDALISEGERVVSGRLTLRHRCLAWLCYIHLCEFGTLPAHLYDPANSNPSRIVSLEHFLFPWSSSEDVHTPPERLISLFQGETPPSGLLLAPHPVSDTEGDVCDDGVCVCVLPCRCVIEVCG